MRTDSQHADHLRTTIYFIGPRYGLVKIGKANDLRKRLWGLQTAHPSKLEVFAAVDAHPLLEIRYHQMFADTRQGGEWFKRSPAITREVNRLNALPLSRGQAQRLQEHRDLLTKWEVPDVPVPQPMPVWLRLQTRRTQFGPECAYATHPALTTRWRASHG